MYIIMFLYEKFFIAAILKTKHPSKKKERNYSLRFYITMCSVTELWLFTGLEKKDIII